jgi:hypothetical protein
MPFQLVELDIKSANPQIIDKIFGFDNWKNVYSSLMQAYEIDRNEAKILFNSTLNNHYLSVRQAKEVYLKAGYDAKESLILSEATANQKSGSWFKLMANQEGQIMDAFIEANFRNDRQIRLHDAVFYEPEFTTISNAVELGIEFGKSIIAKENLTLDLKLDTYKTVLSTPPTEQFIVKQYYNKSRCKQIYKGKNFTFYDDQFLQLSATFNISAPVISKNGIYSNPSESVWLERVQKLYKISTYLNNGTDEHFRTCIEHLASKIQFNKNYIYAILPTWKNLDINDALEYVKNRNWVYNGSVSLSLSDFNSLYHKERRQYIDKVNRSQLKKDIIRLQDAVENNRLYHVNKTKYHSARHYEIGKLIDKVHDLIGYKKESTIDELNRNLKEIVKPYKTEYIGWQEPLKYNSNLPISRHLQIKAHFFLKEKPTILLNLENAVSNIDDLQDINQLFTQPKNQEIMNHKYSKVEPINAHEAFSEPIDYTHSVYANHTSRSALLQGKNFFIGYSRFFRIRELTRDKLWVNTKGYDDMKMAMDGLAIQLYNQNYENVYAESMMST